VADRQDQRFARATHLRKAALIGGVLFMKPLICLRRNH
jgi:hypothetical protein